MILYNSADSVLANKDDLWLRTVRPVPEINVYVWGDFLTLPVAPQEQEVKGNPPN